MRPDPPLAGSDAERRRSVALASALRSRDRKVAVETFWCRPNWPLAQAWHVALAVAGSLLSVDHPHVGAVLIAVALLALLSDWSLVRSPGRLLTGERASQNVVSEPPANNQKVRLVITATYDAARTGLARRLPRLRLGWLAVLASLMLWILVTALLRIEGSRTTLISVLQLLPTFGLILAAAMLLDLAFDRGQDDSNGSGSAAAIALARALDTAPPAELIIELVLTGAGADYGLGLRDYLHRRRRLQNAANTVVLGVGADSTGSPQFLSSDGPLLPLGYYRVLRELAAATIPAARASGCSAALPARMRGLPALNIEGGTTSDRVQAALLLVDAIDGHVGSLRRAAVAAG